MEDCYEKEVIKAVVNAFLLPEGRKLPFLPQGEVFRTHPKIEEKPDFDVCAAKPHTHQNRSSSNFRVGA
jgi:hypothetical protein